MHPALQTPLLAALDCRVPIMLAGMGGVSRHRLAAAVANAGGFGCMGMVREPVELIRAEIAAFRSLSDARFAINLIPAATPATLLKRQVQACLEAAVPALVLFWDVDRELIRHLKSEGVQVIHQVGTRAAAEAALAAGADVLIAQGYEAGGHVHGTTSTLALLPEVVALDPAVPVVAAGGIASGQALVAALAMGAQGASLGSAFLATCESNAHPHHQQRLLAAGADDTLYTRKFIGNWHEAAPVRVLPNAVTRGERAAQRELPQPPRIGTQDGQPVYLFSTDSPLADATGEIDDMAIYAGQSCGQIQQLCSAAERIQKILAQADDVLERFLPR